MIAFNWAGVGKAGAVMQILLALIWAGAVKPHPPSGGEVEGQGQ